MTMTFDDFRVNYSQSYFGMKYAFFKERMVLQGLHDEVLIPCTYPQADTGQSVMLRCVIPTGTTALDEANYKQTNVNFKWEEKLADQENPMVVLDHPPIGLIQADQTCVYLQRKPARQRNRGYCPRYTEPWVPNIELIRYITGGPGSGFTGSNSVLWHIYNPKYTNLHSALLLLQEGNCFGFALSRLLGVCIEDSRKYPLISYRDDVVGYVEHDERIIVNDEAATQSCLDYIYKITGQQPTVR